MLDIKFIRQNVDEVKKSIADRGMNVDVDELLSLDEKRRVLIQRIDEGRALRNKKSGTKPSPEEIIKMRALGDELVKTEKELKDIETPYSELLLKVPNIPSKDTPIGPDESGNKVTRVVGKPTKFPFKPKEHWEIGEKLDILDIERAAKVSGARFVYLKGALALMQYALIQFAFSILSDKKQLAKVIKQANLKINPKPFIPVVPPVIVKPESMSRMGRLEPREERYYIPSDNQYLIGSAEHSLGSMHADETFSTAELPLRYAGMSTAFRREAGSYGKDTKGMLRVHQFDKLELESFSIPEDGPGEQELFVAIQEYMNKQLKLPYRVMAICTGDMGGPDARQIDIETWMPGQDKYRETHTSDYMTDFQSRRLNIKVRRDEKNHEFVHMNDATCIAIGRTLIAIMENYQTKEGTVKVPKALQKYMNGLKEIK